MGTKAGEFIQTLTRNHDVIVIGGLAIIAHGFNRPTKDADVWLDPMDSPVSWADVIHAACDRFPDLTIHTLPGWRRMEGADVATAVDEVGMVRILGLDCPLDVFRRPNEFSEDSFAEVLSRCTRNTDGTWLPDPIDLAVTKDLTNREKDDYDIRFLESKARARWIAMLPHATPEEADALFTRYVDWQTCEAALGNPDPSVKEIAMRYLREFAAEGDPFSAAILEEREIPPP
ncbi:MAG: hypothetical protein ACRCXD_15970 [Luteolibacter sp.]